MTGRPIKARLIDRAARFGARLGQDRSGLALLEFAFTLPILLLMTLTGAELTNYITTKMRISQLALHLADDASRMGSGSQLAAKTITETDINDLFVGANLQSGELSLNTKGRVTLIDLEPVANPNTTNKYKIGWTRCYGGKTTHVSPYRTPTTNLDGIGPTGRQVTAQDDNATMFVEVYYEYTPLVGGTLAPTTSFTEIASMSVRDRRDLSNIYNSNGAPVASC
ncbi:TadE/TadG family type IV pilus assembly protein [Sphingomonas sp. 28-63-12]|uniref:TadE/TadG family type IV pilus assembly protein n=1 Tax=Sphingomonas sp. 28-63-12 TaxID=1970434 RepID=UPI000BD2FD38|nr:MAG: hypothetical protein B7Y47_03605 [Sphingomonas sp. 28-63-12]